MKPAELSSQAARELLEKAIKEGDPEKSKKEALRVRKENWLRFVNTANRAIDEFGVDTNTSNMSKSKPVDIGGASVQLQREVDSQFSPAGNPPELQADGIVTSLVAIRDGEEATITLFSVDQYVSRVPYIKNSASVARNQFNNVATHEEVALARQAADFIYDQLSTQ